MGARANIVAGGIVALVVAVCLAVFALQGGSGAGPSAVAVVHDADGGVMRLPLSENREVTVSTGLGTNVVVVQDGAVFVREADCDNEDCVHQGKVDAPGKQIICLPHKLWIEVVSEGQASGEMDVSAVAGTQEGYDAVAR